MSNLFGGASSSGDITTTAGTSMKAGNPTYADASGGPSTATIPNAKPHAMDDKKKKKKPTPEILEAIKGMGKPYDPDEVGFVSTKTPRQCGTCIKFKKPNICTLPLTIPVDPVTDCCNNWKEPDNSNNSTNERSTVGRRYCRSCSKSADEKTVTCPDCGCMEWTDKPMSKFTFAGGN